MLPIPYIYFGAYAFYVISIFIHLLVLNKIIDYKLVNGGRSKDFNVQKKQSQISIIILVLFLLLIFYSHLYPSLRDTVLFLIVTSVLSVFWILGTIQQLLGTKFEKTVVVWINLIGLISHVLLVVEYFL